jgi:hypothetical protein
LAKRVAPPPEKKDFIPLVFGDMFHSSKING